MGGPIGTAEGTSGKAPKFGGKTLSGESFVLVELLDPSDSKYFKKEMKKNGAKDLTPQFGGDTFSSMRPKEDWMKQVANLDPEWWYISGHFGRTPSLEEELKGEQEKKPVPLFANVTDCWRVEIKSKHTLHMGGLRPPDYTQRFVERLKEGDHRWVDWEKSGPRTLDFTFGLVVLTNREIDITIRNGDPSAVGVTSIVSVDSYSLPPNRFISKPINKAVKGTGLFNDALANTWTKTPFAFPNEYGVEVNKKSTDLYELSFQVPEGPETSTDGCVGYVVMGRWDPGEALIKEEEDRTKLSWAKDRLEKGHMDTDRNLLKGQLESVHLIRPQTARFVFSPLEVTLQDNWSPPKDIYCITDCDPPFDVEKPETKPKWDIGKEYKRCPCEYGGATPNNWDEVSVKFIGRTIDRSTDASFYNQSYSQYKFQSKETSRPESWRIRMEYVDKREELEPDNFLEKHGPKQYPKAKVVLLVGCNTLVSASVRKYLIQLFPNAILLGHIHKNPDSATPIIRNFLNKFFSDKAKARAYDGKHILSSWLSYEHDRPWKDPMIPRSYGLAGVYQKQVYGININNQYNTTRELAKEDETILRLRLYSIEPPVGCKVGCTVDVLLVWDRKGELVTHEGIYEGNGGNVTDFKAKYGDPFKDTKNFPKLTPKNLLHNRGY